MYKWKERSERERERERERDRVLFKIKFEETIHVAFIATDICEKRIFQMTLYIVEYICVSLIVRLRNNKNNFSKMKNIISIAILS